MVNKCSAFGCESDYECNVANDEKRLISCITVEKSRIVCKIGFKANPRKDFVPNKYFKICFLMLETAYFVTGFCELYNKYKLNNTACSNSNTEKQRRRLKDDAVPSKFENMPFSQ